MIKTVDAIVIFDGQIDYISLTDMVRKIDNGLALIEKWLRNKNTIEFLGIWEEMYNEDFDTDAYDEIIKDTVLSRNCASHLARVLSLMPWFLAHSTCVRSGCSLR